MERAEVVCNFDMLTGVRGIAVLHGKVCVVLHEDSRVHMVHFEESHLIDDCAIDIVTAECNKLQWPSDIVANQHYPLLYISDRCPHSSESGVNRPGLFTLHTPSRRVVFTDIDGVTPAGMSVTVSNQLLVACEHRQHTGRSLRLFSAPEDGQLLINRIINLSKLDWYLLQPVMFDSNLFVVSQLQKKKNLHRICMVDDDGIERARSFGGTKRSAWPSVRSPWGVIIDPLNSQRLLLSNCHEHKVTLLDSKLNYLRDLVSPETCINHDFVFLCPRCLCFDHEADLLYVGRRWKGIRGEELSAVLGAITVFRVVDASSSGPRELDDRDGEDAVSPVDDASRHCSTRSAVPRDDLEQNHNSGIRLRNYCSSGDGTAATCCCKLTIYRRNSSSKIIPKYFC